MNLTIEQYYKKGITPYINQVKLEHAKPPSPDITGISCTLRKTRSLYSGNAVV